MDMVLTAWEKITPDCVRNSFVGTEIVTLNAFDENDSENTAPDNDAMNRDGSSNLSFFDETCFVTVWAVCQ